MRKDRREILAVGELAAFLLAWMLGIVATVDDYRDRAHPNAGSDVAATSNFSEMPDVLE